MFKRRKQVNYLDVIPVRNVKEFSEEGGKVMLLVPKFKRAWIEKWFIPGNRSKYFRIHLDELGSRVWLLIDGEKSTGEICDRLAESGLAEKSHQGDLELRVTRFLSQLYKSRFILFKMT